MTQKLFSELGLSDLLLKAIDRLGYEKAAPIQAEAIPLILAGHDVIGQSQTGSGKTAAFAIPAIEMVDPQIPGVQVLVLCQIRALKQGAQIVIGTPGRILDHLSRGTLTLANVRMVVLDESDEMLDMGFRDDIEEVLRPVPKGRQFICFSATMSKPILELIRKQSANPRTVKIEHKVLTVPTVEQAYYEIRGRSKTEALTRLIDLYDLKLGIIFCNTKRMVDELTEEMVGRGYSADRIHGDMSQPQREKVMGRFRSSAIEFLVATDVAARGIDVENVEVVFNYDIPWDEEDYVHRIGRTGRAGRSGRAFSLIAGREIYKLQSIERYTRMKIPRQQVPSLEEVEEKRTNAFFERIRNTLQKGEFQKEARVVDRLLEQGFSSTDIACALVHQLRNEEAPRADHSFEPVREERADPRSSARPTHYRGSKQRRHRK